MVYTVEDLRDSTAYVSVPDWFWGLVPTECPYCGAPTCMQLNFTKLQCSDPRCKAKVTKRTEALLKDLGVKGLGISGIQMFIEEYDLTTPAGVFALRGVDEDGSVFDYEIYQGINGEKDASVKDAIEAVRRRGMKLWELIAVLHLPYLGDKTCKALFGGYNNLDAFYEDKGSGVTAVRFIQGLLGIAANDSEVSLRAAQVEDTLEEFHDDLLDAVDTFGTGHIIQVRVDGDGAVVPGIKAVYTDKTKTDLAANKKEFYRLVADRFPGLDIEWEGSVTRDTSFVISGTGRMTSKLTKAEKYGIPVYFAEQDLLDDLERLANDEYVEGLSERTGVGMPNDDFGNDDEDSLEL